MCFPLNFIVQSGNQRFQFTLKKSGISAGQMAWRAGEVVFPGERMKSTHPFNSLVEQTALCLIRHKRNILPESPEDLNTSSFAIFSPKRGEPIQHGKNIGTVVPDQRDLPFLQHGKRRQKLIGYNQDSVSFKLLPTFLKEKGCIQVTGSPHANHQWNRFFFSRVFKEINLPELNVLYGHGVLFQVLKCRFVRLNCLKHQFR